jgi:anti-sigma regulatory factor (Ser/Thr protein kinase)
MSLALHRIALGPNAASEALALAEAIADPARAGTGARLAVVIEELVLNLVDHANLNRSSDFLLGLLSIPDGVHVVLIDDAMPFDPRTAPHVGDIPNEERGGGSGLAIVRAWSRILTYSRVDGQNRLELIVYPDPDE